MAVPDGRRARRRRTSRRAASRSASPAARAASGSASWSTIGVGERGLDLLVLAEPLGLVLEDQVRAHAARPRTATRRPRPRCGTRARRSGACRSTPRPRAASRGRTRPSRPRSRSGSPGRTSPGTWPLRSMWKSLSAHSACATAWWNDRPLIVSCANSGLSPTISGYSSSWMNASACPTVGQQQVAARLVRLRLERDLHRVALLGDVRAARVDRLGVAVERGGDVLRRVALHALAPAPHHEHRGAELRAEVDRVERLAQRVPADLRVVGGERAVLEDRLREQVGRRHRHPEPGLVERAPEPGDDLVPLGASTSPGGTRSSSWKLTPYAPSSASRWTVSTGSSGGRVSCPNGSRPRLPTVQSPNVKRSRGSGV